MRGVQTGRRPGLAAPGAAHVPSPLPRPSAGGGGLLGVCRPHSGLHSAQFKNQFRYFSIYIYIFFIFIIIVFYCGILQLLLRLENCQYFNSVFFSPCFCFCFYEHEYFPLCVVDTSIEVRPRHICSSTRNAIQQVELTSCKCVSCELKREEPGGNVCSCSPQVSHWVSLNSPGGNSHRHRLPLRPRHR